jgi:hypothetical protein
MDSDRRNDVHPLQDLQDAPQKISRMQRRAHQRHRLKLAEEELARQARIIQVQQHNVQALANDLGTLALAVTEQAPPGNLRDFAVRICRELKIEVPERATPGAPGLAVVRGGCVQEG